ncbi:putative choline kinase [Arachis hypogaea]|nr:putative choline kinase [Arachis hypogaea]
MTTDHESNTERGSIENRGGFVSNMPVFLREYFYFYPPSQNNNLCCLSNCKINHFIHLSKDIGCFLDLFLAFPDALFHQLLVAMAHPDRERQIGAHSVFSMVLMPSMVSPWLDQKTKMAMKEQKPDSISQIKKQELMVEKMNRDIREITDKIKEKISEKDYVAYGMRSSYYWKMEWRRRVARKGKILSNLYVVLDELCFMNNAPRRRSKKEKCFTEEEIDNHNLNSLMRHGSMSLADKKRILRNINTHQRDADKFQKIVVQFNADIAYGMPWKFTPTQREVRVKPGESALAFYMAENKSSTPITGVSTYNVTPMKGTEKIFAKGSTLFMGLKLDKSLVLIGCSAEMVIKIVELLKGFASHEEIMEILATVAVDLGDVIDVSFLQVKPLKGAMTNEVFEINWPAKSDGHLRRVQVRLYGKGVEVFFNREDEIQTFESMSKHGQGPCLLGRFATGRVEELIHARFHVIRIRTETCRKKVRSLEQMNGNLLLELVQEEFMHIWLMDADSCPFFKKEFS